MHKGLKYFVCKGVGFGIYANRAGCRVYTVSYSWTSAEPQWTSGGSLRLDDTNCLFTQGMCQPSTATRSNCVSKKLASYSGPAHSSGAVVPAPLLCVVNEGFCCFLSLPSPSYEASVPPNTWPLVSLSASMALEVSDFCCLQ